MTNSIESKDAWYQKRAHLTMEQVIDDLLIINFLPMNGTPIQKVMRLIEWEVSIALDPQVSEAATRLVDAGFALGKEGRETWDDGDLKL